MRNRDLLASIERALTVLLVVGGCVVETASAQDVLISSRFSNNILRYSKSGAFLGVFASGNGLANPNGIAFGPDRNLYAGLGDTGVVMRFHGRTGAFIDQFVSGGLGGLTGCRAIVFGPDGDLYVAAGPNNKVLRYEAETGALVGDIAQGSGLIGPVGLAFGPNGHLYVGAALSNAVYEFTAAGQLIKTFTAPGHNNATGVLFDGAGLMYVAQSVTNAVVRFDPVTGQNLGVFASGGGLSIPIGLTYTPDGSTLLVGSFGNDSVLKYDAMTGAAGGFFVTSGLGGLDGTHNFAWVPCFADCDESGTTDFFDFLCFQNEFSAASTYADCDGSGTLDFFDFLCFQNEFAAGCP